MGEKTSAFAKGGCGCLGLFVLLGLFALMLGGHFHIDPGGACCLFALGGIVGLIVLAIYNRGKKDASPELYGDLDSPTYLDESNPR